MHLSHSSFSDPPAEHKISLPMKQRQPVVPPNPPSIRPSYVTAHDWGRISISREAWRSGKYAFGKKPAHNRHCMFDEISAKGVQDCGLQVGNHLVRVDLVQMISASIHEAGKTMIRINSCELKLI